MKKKELRLALEETIEKVKSLDKRLSDVEKNNNSTPKEIDLFGGSDGYTTITNYDTTTNTSVEEKKELEVGKWYKSYNKSYKNYDYSFNTGTGTDYGIHSENNNWFEEQYWIKNTVPQEWTLATPQEVESALIEEAKRRGFKDNFIAYSSYSNVLCGDGERVLLDSYGKWAEVIEQDKFAELKEAHKNGAVIQFKLKGSSYWYDIPKNQNPNWDKNTEYRIKPEEKPKVGDVVKAWDSESSAYTVGKVIKTGCVGYFLQDDLWWDNAKTITQQEAIDLLFNK